MSDRFASDAGAALGPPSHSVRPARVDGPATARLRLLWGLLPALQRDTHTARIDQLAHARQCATLAWQATGQAEWALAGLFHDVGRLLDPGRHGDAAAAMLAPVLGHEALWVVALHDEFMLPYAPAGLAVDRDRRERHRQHPWFARACEFADRWDSRAFAYTGGLPLAFLEGLLFSHAAARDASVPAPLRKGALHAD